MGIYTKSILEKEKQDLYAEQMADTALKKNIRTVLSFDELQDTQKAIGHILEMFGFDKESVFGAESVTDLLDCMLDPFCIMYEEADLSESGWKKSGNCFLAFTEEGKAVVLKPRGLGYGYYIPSAEEEGAFSSKLKLSPRAYCIYRPFKPGKNTVYSCIELVFKLLNIRDYLSLIAAAGLVSLLGLCIPAINRWVLNTLIPMGEGAHSALLTAFVLYLTVGVLNGVIQAFKRTSLAQTKMRVSSQVQAAAMAKVLFLPQSFFSGTSTGKISKQISGSRRIVERIMDIVFDVSLTVVFSLVYIPQMASYAPALYKPALAMILLELVISLVAVLVALKNEKEGLTADVEAGNYLYSVIKGIQKIKGTGAERRVYAQWAERYRKVLVYTLIPPGFAKWKTTALSFVKSAGTILLIAIAIPAGISRADYISFNAAYGSLLVAMRQLMNMLQSIFLLKPLIEQIGGLISYDTYRNANKEYMQRLRGVIEVENLTFSYPDTERKCLDDVSFKIRRGEKIGIVGESGCGKSTLLKLLIGMEEPSSGTIYFDGKPMDSLNPRSLRKRIGSVFQFSKVMPGTLYANIAFSSGDVTEEDAWEAAEKAAIADDIRELPLGMDTEISQSNAGGFSGGQKQRILIARAFASKAPVLLLDEATSALDNITQKKVLDHVYESKATVIMVAHRLSTVVGCDRILMFENGRIAEQGSYQELMELDGKFAGLVRKQLVQ